MEPLPETREAVDEFGPFSDDGDLVAVLQAKAERVRRVVPDLVGLSVAVSGDLAGDAATFTLVATDAEVARLDAFQYADDGPCLAALRAQRAVSVDHSFPSEHGWHLFALGTAAAGIATTLTLPVTEGERVVGTINLYAASPGAFDDHHEAVAAAFGAWAPGAVTNADLAFRSRDEARATPHRLRVRMRLEAAAGMLAAATDLPVESAHQRLEDAARRAGIPVTDLAEAVIEALERRS